MSVKDPLQIVLRFLKFRPRSVFEVREKLKSKRVPESEVDRIIDTLLKNHILDDRQFARMWVNDRNRFKPSGNYLLKLELKRLGVDDEIISDLLSNQNEEGLARQAIESKSRLKNAEYEKKVGFLQRRGFSTGVIFKVLK